MKKEIKSKMGKLSRASGKRFELKVREDLEDKGWICDRWTNNVSDVFEQDIGEYVRKLIPAKVTWRKTPKGLFPLGLNSGFPDFVAFRIAGANYNLSESSDCRQYYEVIGVEVKSNGKLDKQEKEKCSWLLDNKIFSRILIAKKKKVGRKVEVEYVEWKIRGVQ